MTVFTPLEYGTCGMSEEDAIEVWSGTVRWMCSRNSARTTLKSTCPYSLLWSGRCLLLVWRSAALPSSLRTEILEKLLVSIFFLLMLVRSLRYVLSPSVSFVRVTVSPWRLMRPTRISWMLLVFTLRLLKSSRPWRSPSVVVLVPRREDAEVNPEVVGMHLRVCLEPWVTCFVAILFGPHSSMLLWMTVVI